VGIVVSGMVSVGWLALALAGGLQDPAAQRLPVPDPARIKEAEKLVREVLKDDYAKKGLEERRTLARKLLQQAKDSKDDMTVAYVLLRDAQAVAAEVCDVATGLAASRETAKGFAVDPLSLDATFLAEAAKTAKAPASYKELAEANLKVSASAMEKEDFDLAERTAKEASATARKAKEIALVGQADAAVKGVGSSKLQAEAVKGARETLAKNPADPTANFEVGAYACFVRERWDEGLPGLAKGSDPALAGLARADLNGPSEGAGQIAVADGWWEHAEQAKAEWKGPLRRRAAHWYAQALPQASGLSKLRIEKRLTEAGGAPKSAAKGPGAGASGAVDFLKTVDVARDSIDRPWTREGAALVSPPGAPTARLQLSPPPTEEYELRLVVQKRGVAKTGGLNVGLASGRAQFTIAIDITDGSTMGIGTLDGKPGDGNESTVRNNKIFVDDKPKALVIQVRKGGLQMSCDGRPVFTWKGDINRGGVHPVNQVPNRQALFFASKSAELVFTQIVLVPLAPENPAKVGPVEPPFDPIGTWVKQGTGTEFFFKDGGVLDVPGAQGPRYRVGKWHATADSVTMDFPGGERIVLRVLDMASMQGGPDRWLLKRKP
jgi:hypothetical protein